MPYAIIAIDKPGAVAVRADNRPAHLEHLDRFAAKLLAGGAVLADDGATPVGSLIVFELRGPRRGRGVPRRRSFHEGGPVRLGVGLSLAQGLLRRRPRMNVDQLRELQAPIKSRYRDEPESAVITLRAKGEIGQEGLACRVETGRALVEAGLHPATGGSGLQACSGDMLLEALAACAGVTLSAVATALGIEVRKGTVERRGRPRFPRHAGRRQGRARSASAPSASPSTLDTDAGEEQLASLLKLTERYCVVLQTLRVPAETSATLRARLTLASAPPAPAPAAAACAPRRRRGRRAGRSTACRPRSARDARARWSR